MSRHFPALRGIAILLVIINHSVTLGLQFARNQEITVPPWQKFILISIKELGIFAVPLFLFLAASYFVYAAQGKNLKSMFRLIPNNLMYIALPYLIWSLLYYLLEYVLFNKQQTMIGYAKSLIVGYPNNFVPLLFFFTLLAPFLIWISRKAAWLVFLLFLSYQSFLVVLLRPDIFGEVIPNWANVFALPIIRLPIALWGIFYPLGIIYGLNSEAFKKQIGKSPTFVFVITLLMLGLAISTQLGFTNLPIIEIITPLFGLLGLLVINRDQIPFARFFERLGKRSYGLYLINLMIINILYFLLIAIGFKQILSFQILIVIVVGAITLFLPLLLMEGVEKKAGRLSYRVLFG